MSKNVFLIAGLAIFGIFAPSFSAAMHHVPTVPILVAPTFNEDTHLLLAHKWEKGDFYLDLKINGTFEAKIDGQNVIYGLWELSDDRKILNLKNDPIDEDTFSIKYTISEVSFHSMKVVDSKGKAVYLNAVD